ncbi:MAG: carboxypeptidase-like regulatory domain-containing protein [Chitinophagaceae bacterium]
MKRILFLIVPAILIAFAFRPSTAHTITGKITDETGISVPSVLITVKGTKVSTTSANDGTYQITVNDKNATLVFSSVGYQTKEIKIGGKTVIDVSLVSAVKDMQEVVITAYGAQKRKAITGSVATISPQAYNYSQGYISNQLQGECQACKSRIMDIIICMRIRTELKKNSIQKVMIK